MASDKNTQKKKKKRSVFWRIIRGQLLTLDFFARHWLKIAVLVVMILVYIS